MAELGDGKAAAWAVDLRPEAEDLMDGWVS